MSRECENTKCTKSEENMLCEVTRDKLFQLFGQLKQQS